MRNVLLSVISLFAVASAFTPVKQIIRTTAPRSTEAPSVTVVAPRDRRATIVNDGKANGRFSKKKHLVIVPNYSLFCLSDKSMTFWVANALNASTLFVSLDCIRSRKFHSMMGYRKIIASLMVWNSKVLSLFRTCCLMSNTIWTRRISSLCVFSHQKLNTLFLALHYLFSFNAINLNLFW